MPGEIVTGVRLPVPHRAAFVKFPNPASRFALAGVFVAEGTHEVRVAVTGAAPCVFRWTAAEEHLSGSFDPPALAGLTLAAAGLNSDLHADAVYRANLVAVMARCAVAKALA